MPVVPLSLGCAAREVRTLYGSEEQAEAKRLIEISKGADEACELFLGQEWPIDTPDKEAAFKCLRARASQASSNFNSFCIDQRKLHPI